MKQKVITHQDTRAEKRPLDAFLAHMQDKPFHWLAGMAILLMFQISPCWIPIADGTSYISMARSLAAGHGLTRYGQGHLYHPFGYSLAIFPAFLTGDRPFLLISIIHWLLSLIFMSGVYVWMRRKAPDSATLLTLFVMVNAGVLYLFRRTASEALFMPLLIWSAVCLDDLLDDKNPGRSRLLLFPAAFLVSFLCMTRQAGFCLVAGFGLLCWFRFTAGKLRLGHFLMWGAVLGGLAAMTICGMMLYDKMQAANGQTYVLQMMDPNQGFAQKVAEGLRLRICEYGRILIPFMFKAYGRSGEWLNPVMILYVPFAAYIMVGWWKTVRHAPDTFSLMLPFYLLLFIVWGHDQGVRFMVPVLPVLALALAKQLAHNNLSGRRLLLLLIPLHLVSSALYGAKDWKAARKDNQLWPELIELTSVLPRHVQNAGVTQMDNAPKYMLSVLTDSHWEGLDLREAEKRMDVIVMERSGQRPATEFKCVFETPQFLCFARVSE